MAVIGAIWVGKTLDGKDKLSVKMNDTNYTAIRNKDKTPINKQPDWLILGDE